VSTAAMAAAVPKLLTLKAVLSPDGSWNFHTGGSGRLLLGPSAAAACVSPRRTVAGGSSRDWRAYAPPLTLLEELAWNDCTRPAMLSAFLGARPIVLHAPCALVAECLTDRNPRCESLVARACQLRVVFGRAAPAVIARVLRAARRLRTCRVEPTLHGPSARRSVHGRRPPSAAVLECQHFRTFGFPRRWLCAAAAADMLPAAPRVAGEPRDVFCHAW
jgi:hypothetical protein